MTATRRTGVRPHPVSKTASFAMAAACAFLVATSIDALAAPEDTDVLSAVAGLCAAIAAFSLMMRSGHARFEKIVLALLIGAAGYGVAEYARTTADREPSTAAIPRKD